jgi:hypothetical protein
MIGPEWQWIVLSLIIYQAGNAAQGLHRKFIVKTLTLNKKPPV